MKEKKRRKKGMTIPEVLIALLIIATMTVMLAGVTGTAADTIRKSRENRARTQAIMEQYWSGALSGTRIDTTLSDGAVKIPCKLNTYTGDEGVEIYDFSNR